MRLSVISDDARRPGATRAAGPARHTERHQDRCRDTARSTWLVGDIGGTNARFAFVDAATHELTDIRVFPCAGHRDLAGLVRHYGSLVGVRDIAAACVAFAGPVVGDQCRSTNAELEFSISQTTRELGLQRLDVINDFAAAALAAYVLSTDHAVVIGTPQPRSGLPIAVLGPGTGLGVATLIPSSDHGPLVVPGEGGHVLIGPFDDAQWEVFRASRSEGVALTAEMLLSGPGLVRLHRLLCLVGGVRYEPLRPEEICGRALASDGTTRDGTTRDGTTRTGTTCTDETCTDTVQMFCAILGSVAANTALTTGARGGIYLTGGILPRIENLLVRSMFRARFDANPEMEPYLSNIATVLMTDPFPGLRGAAVALDAATAQERFAS